MQSGSLDKILISSPDLFIEIKANILLQCHGKNIVDF